MPVCMDFKGEIMMLPIDYVIVGDNLIRGPRPQELDVIRPFKYVFNLEVGWFDAFHGDVDRERGWCATAGAEYCHRPMSDFWAPSANQLAYLVGQIHGSSHLGMTLVHCLHGEDRTGMVCAAYRIMVQGWSLDQAVNEMMIMGFHKWAYWWWLPVLGKLK